MVYSQKPNDTSRDQGTERGVHHESPEEEKSGRVDKENQQDETNDNFVLGLTFHFVFSKLCAKPR
jgi:hypothetical protein